MEQLDILLGVISSLGKPNKKSGGNMFMDFGTLFIVYQDISDTVVGMIQRGRKKKLLNFDGEMLFQGQHDNVKITLTDKGMKRVKDKDLKYVK